MFAIVRHSTVLGFAGERSCPYLVVNKVTRDDILERQDDGGWNLSERIRQSRPFKVARDFLGRAVKKTPAIFIFNNQR